MTLPYDPVQADPARSSAPYRVFNIGNHAPIQLMSFIEAIEQSVGKEAIKNFMPMQDGDVPATHADVEELAQWTAPPRHAGARGHQPFREVVSRVLQGLRDQDTPPHPLVRPQRAPLGVVNARVAELRLCFAPDRTPYGPPARASEHFTASAFPSIHEPCFTLLGIA